MSKASVDIVRRQLNLLMGKYGALLAKLDDDRGVTERDYGSAVGLGGTPVLFEPKVVEFVGEGNYGVTFTDNNGIHRTIFKGSGTITVEGTNQEMLALEAKGYITISEPAS